MCVHRPYIHKAICQSGTSLMEWAVEADPVGKTRRLAQVLGCPVENGSDKEILEYLKQQSSVDLHAKMLETLSPDEKRRDLPIPFKPCVETNVVSTYFKLYIINQFNALLCAQPGAFLTKSVIELLNNPNAIEIPLLMGYNDSEGICLLEATYKYIEQYDKDLERMIPRSLDVPLDQAESLRIADTIRDLYFCGRTIDKSTLNQMTTLLTDKNFLIHMIMSAELHARTQHK